jgi:hypothetical protein
LTNKYKPDHIDESALQNIADQELNNTSNAIQNSGGSQGEIRANLLGAGLNKTKALSDAYFKSKEFNANQNATAQQFDLGVDNTNLQQSNQELDINDRNKGNYDTQKSKLISKLGDNIGDIGKEQTYKKLAKKMFGYSYDGKYWVKPDGTKIDDKQLQEEIEQEKEKQSKSKALGGYLTNLKKY